MASVRSFRAYARANEGSWRPGGRRCGRSLKYLRRDALHVTSRIGPGTSLSRRERPSPSSNETSLPLDHYDHIDIRMKSRLYRAAIAALLAAAVAGSTAMVLLGGLGVPYTLAQVWLPVTAVALLLGFGTLHRAAAFAAFAGLVALGAAFLLPRRASFAPLAAWVRSLVSGVQPDEALLPQFARLLCPVVSAFLSLCMFGFMWSSGGTSFAVMVFFAALMVGYSLSPSLPFRLAVPGLVGCAAAFSLSGHVNRDRGAWRALLAAVLAVALAFVFVPHGRVTWAPLVNAAEQVRAIIRDYFLFTEERIPFTITSEGYNMAVREEGDIVSRLGGPATPHDEPVMEVTASRRVLLRGTIRRTYTGQSWVDPDAKSRYLFYSPLHADIREDVFGMEGNEPFDTVDATVRFLRQDTSALFVPSRLESFSMDFRNAVHFNSIGELFLSQQTQPGDTYSFTGGVTGDGERLRDAVAANAGRTDSLYDDAVATCLQLPEGIEPGVYQLTDEIVAGLENPYDKARAIELWLKANCTYALDVEQPDARRDFVSGFLLGTRRGYCSYFASAMTVMCRIAGVPARYVEGYAAEASATPVTLTGENAHAWTEVCFAGIGWVSFDPSNGGPAVEQGDLGQAAPDQPEPPQDGGAQPDEGGEHQQGEESEEGEGAQGENAGVQTPTPEPPQGQDGQDGSGQDEGASDPSQQDAPPADTSTPPPAPAPTQP
ncbi:MAG: hypothetical protein E7317_06130, partial [Clostridiales bacterium]|nr:hypothetical protein [Clostridiales bacterium]